MAEDHEADVAKFLTRGGKVFLAPQYDIPSNTETKEGGTCPDFVVLDFERREVVIVEVTKAASLKPNLLKYIAGRKRYWYDPARRMLESMSDVIGRWEFRFLGFVRSTALKSARIRFLDQDDVTFFSIESATFDWRYWDNRLPHGLPDRRHPMSMLENSEMTAQS